VPAILLQSMTNDYQKRGLSPATDPTYGFIGVQAHTGRVAF
jgi:hypothetical protein